MKSISASRTFGLCGLIALVAGCASEPQSHVVSAPPPPAPVMVTPGTTPPPMVVTTATGTSSSSTNPTNTIIVTQAPPAQPVQEAVVAQPSPRHVWVPGFYTWRNNRYEWMAGHWEVPPRTGSVWVAPRYYRESSGVRFYEGYWN